MIKITSESRERACYNLGHARASFHFDLMLCLINIVFLLLLPSNPLINLLCIGLFSLKCMINHYEMKKLKLDFDINEESLKESF